jgi:hypothetical protein
MIEKMGCILRRIQPALAALLVVSTLHAQDKGETRRPIPSVLNSVLSYDDGGVLRLSKNGELVPEIKNTDRYDISQMSGSPAGVETGIALDFHDLELNGTVSYGTYQDKSKFPVIAFLPRPVEIRNGHALLEIKKTFDNSNDIYHFTENGEGVLGFRVMNTAGKILYEGRVAFSGKGPYQVLPTIIEGPLVNLLGPTGCVISFETQVPAKTSVMVDGKIFGDEQETLHHEIAITGLLPSKTYNYVVQYGERSDKHTLKTAPEAGSRKPFTFGFVADNRSVIAAGEREFGQTNYQITRTGMAAAVARNISFMQAMGGQTTGNNPSTAGHMLEYANYKRALEPFWSTTPVNVGMGNHEGNYHVFAADSVTKKTTRIDQFPYETESGEAAFAKSFVNPTNGPESEDGASYDPNPNVQDFPTYKENVYYYTYGNLAMIVLNSEYWKSQDLKISGSPEGYVMDQQLKWLDETIQKFEKDPKIDHVFINLHSSMFPNGDHADAGMWYDGKNDMRPNIMGVPTDKGIIERRDQLIDVAINHSKKVIGFLVGSEHNFAMLEVTPDLDLYPKAYTPAKLKVNRRFFYIQNGGGGAYAYALMNNNPWMDKFQFFTAPPSMALFHVNGPSVTLEAFNPETFEKICEDVKLR